MGCTHFLTLAFDYYSALSLFPLSTIGFIGELI